MQFHEILYENSATGDHTTTITFEVPKQWPLEHMTWDQQYNHLLQPKYSSQHFIPNVLLHPDYSVEKFNHGHG